MDFNEIVNSVNERLKAANKFPVETKSQIKSLRKELDALRLLLYSTIEILATKEQAYKIKERYDEKVKALLDEN